MCFGFSEQSLSEVFFVGAIDRRMMSRFGTGSINMPEEEVPADAAMKNSVDGLVNRAAQLHQVMSAFTRSGSPSALRKPPPNQ